MTSVDPFVPKLWMKRTPIFFPGVLAQVCMLNVTFEPASVCTPSTGWVKNASVEAVDPERAQFM
ncbi:hypothetical protein D3C71_2017390 [compost metagenome]